MIQATELPATAALAETLRINTSIKPPFSTEDQNGFLDQLIFELARRTGVDVELVRMPPKQALEAADAGRSHGEMPRIADMEKSYPNLVMVDEPLLSYHFVGFCNENVEVDGWQGLAGNQVGFISGWKIYEHNVPEDTEFIALADVDALFGMLQLGRIDVALYERYAGWERIRRDGHVYLRECGGPLAERPMYLYLHVSRAELAPLLAQALRDMKQDGTYQVIQDRTL